VLDIGAGDGELLRILGRAARRRRPRHRDSRARVVNECVAKGLAVIQGDADTTSPTTRTTRSTSSSCRRPCRRRATPRVVLEHMLRIGQNAWCRFRISATGKSVSQLFFGGHMPSTDNLPYSWWDSPNIHFCTIKDFRALCDVTGAKMERAVAFNAGARRCASTRRGGSGTCSASRRCSC
jgi:methionine biosynthesis protein MetW